MNETLETATSSPKISKIREAVIRIAGNSQDGIQAIGGFLARLAGRSEQEVMTFMTIPATISGGATFVARTTSTNPNHVLQMMEAAMDHDGFSFIECLSECVEFYEGAFDASNPRKGGVFNAVPAGHDVTDELAAYKLAGEPFPGSFGIFYKVNKPTKNAKEAEINKSYMEKVKGLKDWQILQNNFDKMK